MVVNPVVESGIVAVADGVTGSGLAVGTGWVEIPVSLEKRLSETGSRDRLGVTVLLCVRAMLTVGLAMIEGVSMGIYVVSMVSGMPESGSVLNPETEDSSSIVCGEVLLNGVVLAGGPSLPSTWMLVK